jgi:hypothetical protein
MHSLKKSSHMQIDLTYLPAEDRMRLSLRGHADWWITRILLIKLINAWVQKIEGIDLPDIGIPLGHRDVGQEHAMSLEFDGPTSSPQKLEPTKEATLLQEVTLSIDPLGANLVFKGQGTESNLQLTRKESHMVLEMLASKAKAVGWTDTVIWPNWLAAQHA